ncbi:methyltransferase [Streptacidiphilus monticola]|uniref:Methyltransferase n=1 Tax=Streptacidiphilus monticola TaxID=2161674 RepID=A0ABW1G3M4_9ACTN
MTDYRPRLTEAEQRRIRAWHDSALAMMRVEAGAAGQTFDYLGLSLFVPPQVQPITGMSHLLGEAVLAEVRPQDRVLDMGTGSGVNALLAAGTAREVVALDVNPEAVTAARANAERNGVRIDVRESDVFSALTDADGRFDLVVFDPPFRWFEPRDLLEQATADPGYRALTAFFAQVRRHLAPGGRVLLAFGSSGDLAYLRELMDRHGFTVQEVARAELVRDGVTVEYLTFRLH